MKVYPYHTPDGIIELVEKQELDELAGQVADFGVLVDKLERELQDAVKRMEELSKQKIEDAYWSSWEPHQNIRNLFIKAAKGES